MPSPIEAFCEVAPPILNKFLEPNACITKSRIAIECLRPFGVLCEARAVKWLVQIPAKKLAYVAGLSPEERAETQKQAASFVDRQTDDEGGGYWGHVVVIANRTTLLDPSFCQSFHAFGLLEIPEKDFILAADTGEVIADSFRLEAVMHTDTGYRINAQYVGLEDMSFKDAPAWEFDATMKVIVWQIIAGIMKYRW